MVGSIEKVLNIVIFDEIKRFLPINAIIWPQIKLELPIRGPWKAQILLYSALLMIGWLYGFRPGFSAFFLAVAHARKANIYMQSDLTFSGAVSNDF